MRRAAALPWAAEQFSDIRATNAGFIVTRSSKLQEIVATYAAFLTNYAHSDLVGQCLGSYLQLRYRSGSSTLRLFVRPKFCTMVERII